MKTTVDIADELFARLKRLSLETGRPMRSLIEEGLRRVLEHEDRPTWTLPDRSVGDPDGRNPLAGVSWSDLRDEIYGSP